MRQHNNNKMSLPIYLVVEKPNKQLRKTLGQIHLESSIISIEKLENNNIDVWSRQHVVEAENFSNRNVYQEVFNITTVNTISGEIVGTREFTQSASRYFSHLGK